jgi:hypothetical protein
VVVAVEEEDNLDTIRIIEVKEVVPEIFRHQNSAEILETLIKGTIKADTAGVWLWRESRLPQAVLQPQHWW